MLKFTTDAVAYPPAVFARFEGMVCYNYSPLIYLALFTKVSSGSGQNLSV